MSIPSRSNALPNETPLEEGLRRYAPKVAGARIVPVSDVLVSLLLMRRPQRFATKA